ncbi:MAG: polysaccharide biosynthesis protein [Bacteroidales bacterium]|nr:polysaccharide biosynthesis protein [Bacteroidales bacterium]
MVKVKKLIGQTAIYGTTTILGRLLNYLLVPFHTYIFLEPKAYGVVGDLYAWVALLLVLLTYGMETTFFRFSEMEKDRSNVFRTTLTCILCTSAIFILLGLLFNHQIADILKYPSHPEYIRWFIIIVGLDAISTIPFAKLRAENKPIVFASVKITNILINVFFNVFFLWFCPFMIAKGWATSIFSTIYNPNMGVGYIFIANLIASACQIILLLFVSGKIHLHIDKSLLKKMLKYAFPLLILGLAGIINEVIDRFMVKNLSADNVEDALHNLGVYSACFKIAIIMNLFIQAFRYSAEPFFFSQYKEKDAKEGYSVVMTYFVIACTVIFLGTMMYIDFIKYFVSAKYHEGLSVVPILLLAYMLLGVCFNLSIWYKLTGQTSYGAYITIGGAVITIVSNFILVPKIGYMGAAWGHLITYIAMTIASYLMGQKYFPINYNLKKMGFYISLSLILFFISYFLIPFDIFGQYQVFAKTIINTVILLLYLAVIVAKERKNIKAIL